MMNDTHYHEDLAISSLRFDLQPQDGITFSSSTQSKKLQVNMDDCLMNPTLSKFGTLSCKIVVPTA